MNEEKIKILGKEEEKIKKRIENFENQLPKASFENNQLGANWDEKGKLLDRMKEYNIPGVSIAVINNFEIEWIKSYGIANVNTQKEVTLETIFEAGSASKTFTATAALQMVENNKVDLNEDVNNKFKTWKIPENDLTQKEKVTLYRLLTHTAGINRPDSMFSVKDDLIPTLNQVLNGESPALNDPVKVEFTPGTNHQYSNLGYIVIEKLLNDLSGKNLSVLMKENVFNPLEMANSIFNYPSVEIKKQAAVPHDQEGIAKETGMHPTATGQGGLMTTPYDLAKFVLELINTYNGKSEKILSNKMAQNMISSHLDLDPAKFFGFTGQGLGVFLIQNDKDISFVHPGTNAPGFVCAMYGIPSTGQGVVIMSNGIQAELLHIELMFFLSKEYNWPFWK